MGEHPIFAPDQQSEFLDFFAQNNYGVVSDSLQKEDIQFLNEFVDRSQQEIPVEWGIGKKEVYSHGQILVHHPELDPYIQSPVTFPLVKAILGPQVRFAQFDFRDVPQGSGFAPMRYHKDRNYYPPEGANPRTGRFAETSYVCAIIYLSDVDEDTPSFCVVPNSYPREYETVDLVREKMGDAYCEVPIRGPAGTAVLYNINIYHTRLPGRTDRGRRTQHCYFSCATSPALTNWVLLPRRLAEHPDPEQRRYFRQWPEAARAFAAAGYSLDFYKAHVMEKPT